MPEQPVGCRLQGDGGEAAAKIRLVHGDHEMVAAGIGPEPGQGELVRRGQQHEGVGGAAPTREDVRVRGREVDSGVR